MRLRQTHPCSGSGTPWRELDAAQGCMGSSTARSSRRTAKSVYQYPQCQTWLLRPMQARMQQQQRLRSPTQSTAAEAPSSVLGVSASAPAPPFDWHRQWYPLMVVEDADPKVPHATQLLGMDLVLWRDKVGAWRCFEDRCPHRLAALSEGRIDHKTGDLFCNYHGWTFAGTGKCTSIPQLPDKGSPQALGSPRACTTSYPTRCAEGLIWVWANAGPDAEAEAAAAPWKGLAPQIDAEGEGAFLSSHRWYFRDIPAGYIANKENSFNDPSHDTILHHGVLPVFSREKASPITVTVGDITVDGYTARLGSAALDRALFPCGQLRASEKGVGFRGLAYTTPAAEGRVFSFIAFLRGEKPGGGFSPLRLVQATRWLGHLSTHSLVDADNAIQYSVDRNRAKGPQRVYLPAEADRGPAAFWTWLERFGGGGPFGVATMARPIDPSRPGVPRRVLLDRFDQHTRHCKPCRDAHTVFSVAAKAAGLLAAALAVASVAIAAVTLAAAGGASSLPKATLAGLLMLVAGTGVAALVHRALAHMVQQFVFVDYDKLHPSKLPAPL